MITVAPLSPPCATHAPALAAVVDALAQQPHAAQPPGARSAEEAQQQPPAQRLVPQSASEAQGSPGDRGTHAPEPGRHAVQPSAAAAALQQKPARQAPKAHVEEGPAGAQCDPGGKRAGVRVGNSEGATGVLGGLVPERVDEGVLEEDGATVGVFEGLGVVLQEGAAVRPGCAQVDGQGQERQVVAPMSGEYVPAGQGMGSVEERGQ